MQINLLPTKGLIKAIDRLTSQVERVGDLYELHLQHTERLMTRTTTAEPSDDDVHVAYTDPILNDLIESIERGRGRRLTDEEVEEVSNIAALAAQQDEA